MSRLEKVKEKAKGLEAKDPKGAIETWLEALKIEEADGQANPDLSIYNRIGDLCLKMKDPGQAADYYERAVDKYAELGFHNNAIAMCNKVLRNAPGRPTAYLKLAKLYASKGFLAEAKLNFVEYAERMHKAGKIQHAFAALKEFADLSPEAGGLRAMLEEQLELYGAPNRPAAERASAPPAPKVPEPPHAPGKGGSKRTSSLVFLDLDEPPARPSAPARPTPPREPESAPVNASLLMDVTPEPDTSLEIETTSLADEAPSPVESGMIDGLERTADFAETQATAAAAPSLRDEDFVDDVEPLADLEPTIASEAVSEVEEDIEVLAELEPFGESELEIEPPPPLQPKPLRMTNPAAGTPPSTPPRVTPVVPRRPGAPVPKGTTHGAASADTPKLKPLMPKRPSPPGAAGPPKRKPIVEVPPLELEPDFESATAGTSHDVDDQPLAKGAKGFVQTEFVESDNDESVAPSRRSGFIDLGLDEVMSQGEHTSSLLFTNVEPAPSARSIEELEALVADDPDDPETHQALGEALVEGGDRERGIEELDHATAGLENRGDLGRAQELTGEILRLDPNSVRHRQKLVEYAFKSGDKARLVDAYLELADTLLRGDLPDKARAVYQRVAEHDRTNERAKAALSMLAPVSEPKSRSGEFRAAPKDAKMKVRDEPGDVGDFVDLGAMILEDEGVTRNTRMTVADEEPTGDEEKDFRDMLARFKQGIDENIEETDFQSHYDLGVAFKEMGLLDEAIAEFQKALAAPEGKLRTTESLGACFIERHAYVVAESILRRGLDLPASGDRERLGVLYWLARALEELGKKVEARELYGRVFAVDIRFADVGERVKALAKAK